MIDFKSYEKEKRHFQNYRNHMKDAVKEGKYIATPYQRLEKKIGRNKICPCGSGLKFKKCCGKEV